MAIGSGCLARAELDKELKVQSRKLRVYLPNMLSFFSFNLLSISIGFLFMAIMLYTYLEDLGVYTKTNIRDKNA
jgi:hypothetical protein